MMGIDVVEMVDRDGNLLRIEKSNGRYYTSSRNRHGVEVYLEISKQKLQTLHEDFGDFLKN